MEGQEQTAVRLGGVEVEKENVSGTLSSPWKSAEAYRGSWAEPLSALVKSEPWCQDAGIAMNAVPAPASSHPSTCSIAVSRSGARPEPAPSSSVPRLRFMRGTEPTGKDESPLLLRTPRTHWRRLTQVLACWLALASWSLIAADALRRGFTEPPHAAKPWVYWFWMDGNVSREGITADLEAMQRAGLGGLVLMEVDVGVPRGPVRFMSEPWQALFAHAVQEAQRLGLEITLNAGPGWTGSGGPWVKPDQSMQHLVASAIEVTGPTNLDLILPQAKPRDPHFVHAPVPASLREIRETFYRDVAVMAFPTPAEGPRLADSDEKALYYRNPYSSHPGVRPFLPAPANHPDAPAGTAVDQAGVIELTDRLRPGGRLAWTVPAGRWTVMRFGRTSTGANTRPAPEPGIGLESDKFDQAALEAHFEEYVGALLRRIGSKPSRGQAGWTMLHIDSWEMGAQNWSARFRDEFRQRRGYDPLAFLPAMTGRVVGSVERSERFLWDIRQTAQELVVENHAGHLKKLGRRHGFGLSIEPYDMNPCSDLVLGGVADIPMCEFWATGHGFDSSFSCLESVSIAHTLGRPIVAAEAFTSGDSEAWRLHPGVMKAQADWAFCAGINRLVFHRYAHQPWLDRRPGMTMGPYGVHYERTQTWWDLVGGWHDYLARCQFMLQQGLPVADICYLTPEGAPHVFRPPRSAVRGPQPLPDRRGYNFDGCAPGTVLEHMSVKAGRLTLPGGMSYRLLVLPEVDTMTPELLRKVRNLVRAGATVLGSPPAKSPSLANYPRCDAEVQQLAAELWGAGPSAAGAERTVGKGRVIRSPGPEPLPASPPPTASLPTKAHWIWHAEGNPAQAAPPGTRHFRRTFDLQDLGAIAGARLLITADNAFAASLNGTALGTGDNFHVVYELDLGPALKSGSNLLTVSADNGATEPNPAGLIASIEIRLRNGGITRIHTDGRWESALAQAGPWTAALDLGALGAGPWGNPNKPSTPPTFPDLYASYEQAARVLDRMGVSPDFASDVPLRYAHRRVGGTEVYFVANGSDQRVLAHCLFRVQECQPQLWDPRTGAVRNLPQFHRERDRIALPLELEPHGSCFLVFDRHASRGVGEGQNTVSVVPVAEIAGPWQVRFPPDRGAPESIVLDRLVDWSTHSDPGVRHFSGIATYATRFEASPGPGRLFLDLGQVAVMARVKVNGRPVGTAWVAPFRLDITPAVQPGTNALEVEVANLWPNRLIGDRALPEDQRVTWTTWNPYRSNTPLLQSGLLGPVTIMEAKSTD